MSRFPRRGRLARLAVGVVALGAGAVGATTALAQMGTSSNYVTTTRADLVSVTTPGFNGVDSANFCFRGPLGFVGTQATNYTLLGYNNDEFLRGDFVSQLGGANTNCVVVDYNNDDTNDLRSYSAGQVAQGAVTKAGGSDNLIDSVPLNVGGAFGPQHNGTRGFTIAPDLQLAQVRSGQNRIGYLFDQKVKDSIANFCDGAPFAGPGCNAFKFIDIDGDEHFAIGASLAADPISGEPDRVVVAQFCPIPNATPSETLACNGFDPSGSDVNDAEIAVAEEDAVHSQTANGFSNDNREFSVIPLTLAGTPNGTGDTALPDLINTEVNAVNGDTNQMLFTYNDAALQDPGNESDCYAIMSNARRVTADDITILTPQGGNGRVLVTFTDTPTIQNVTEFIVGGGDTGGCVEVSSGDRVGDNSTQGAKPAGGNVGAVQTGYSTGSDAQALAVNRTNDTMTARLDQRIDNSLTNLSCIHQVGPNGNNGSSPDSLTIPVGAPGPKNGVFDFGSTGIQEGTVGLRLTSEFDPNGCGSNAVETFDSAGSLGPQGNVDQVFGPGGALAP